MPQSRFVKAVSLSTFLAREIVELEKSKLDGLSAHFGVPYRFYVGTKTESFDSIEQKRVFDSLGEDLGLSIILARKIVTSSKAQLYRCPIAFGIPYRFYVGTHNENHAFIEQKRVFDSLGEDLGPHY
jgi:hypothetical protein